MNKLCTCLALVGGCLAIEPETVGATTPVNLSDSITSVQLRKQLYIDLACLDLFNFATTVYEMEKCGVYEDPLFACALVESGMHISLSNLLLALYGGYRTTDGLAIGLWRVHAGHDEGSIRSVIWRVATGLGFIIWAIRRERRKLNDVRAILGLIEHSKVFKNAEREQLNRELVRLRARL